MKPTKQTILHDPANGKHGNCMSAVIASLLHLPIEDVPVFSNPTTWVKDLNAYLANYGLAYILVADPAEWILWTGVQGCYHEVAGPSPRDADTLHACVGVDGKVAFDPHPDNTGVSVDGGGFFVALRPWEVANAQLIREAATTIEALLNAFTSSEAGEVDKRLAVLDARKMLKIMEMTL